MRGKGNTKLAKEEFIDMGTVSQDLWLDTLERTLENDANMLLAHCS